MLVNEALEGLGVVENGRYVDGTFGRGGHSALILERLGEQGRLFALDKDPEAVAYGRERFVNEPRIVIEHGGFETLAERVADWTDGGTVDGILLDLGVSSPQIDTAERGFSFSYDGPLDMRMDVTSGETAAEWLGRVDERDLRDVLFRFGEEPRARRIAAAIVRVRSEIPIETTAQLAQVVVDNSGYRDSRTHPATRVFQAIRIQINGELDALGQALDASVNALSEGGRLCIISFHSLEDRLVKRFIAREAAGDPAYRGLPDIPVDARPRLRRVGKLVRPEPAELAANPRARSARLRIAERLGVAAA